MFTIRTAASRTLAGAGLVVLMAGSASATSLVDWTANGTPLSGSILGTTYTVSASGGSITNSQVQDGGTCPGFLACDLDGLGIEDDEISGGINVGEELTVAFDEAIRIKGIHLLDFFSTTDGQGRELAHVSFDGGSTFNSYQSSLSETPDGDSGYFEIAGISSPISSIILRAPTSLQGDDNNDQLGVNDYALAAIQAVPLPAPILMLLSALAGLGFISARSRTA